MENHKKSLFVQSLVDLFILSFIFAIGISFYRYYHQKNYDYLVESSCNPFVEKCFTRDCSNPDDCPPNQLSIYKEYHVKAYDFPKCENNSCAFACMTGSIECKEVTCDEVLGNECRGPMGIE